MAPFEAVLWTVPNFENCIVGHCFLDFNIFHIFLKLFKLYFRAVWVKLSGLISFFLTSSHLPQISNQPKTPPKVRCIENPFSPSACTSLCISCLQNYQIFPQLVAPLCPGDQLSPERDDRHLREMSQMERKSNAWYR